MDRKGQALVEFVIILPIIIFILLATIDIGKIFYTKSILENKISDAITMYQNSENINIIKNKIEKDVLKGKLNIREDGKYIEFSMSKNIQIITPGLNLIFKNPYKINVKRVVYNENK